MSNDTTTGFISENTGILLFFLSATVIFTAFYSVYEYFILDSELFKQYLELCTQVASQQLSLIGIDHRWELSVAGIKTRLSTDFGAYILVAKGCDASVVFAVLISTIAAWPGLRLKKLIALTAGLALMFVLNTWRIAGMLLVDMYFPSHFDIMHEWVLPGLLVLAALAYFFIWTQVSGQHPAD